MIPERAHPRKRGAPKNRQRNAKMSLKASKKPAVLRCKRETRRATVLLLSFPATCGTPSFLRNRSRRRAFHPPAVPLHSFPATCGKPRRSTLLVPGDMRAGHGFWNQCAHWWKKQFLKSACRPKRFGVSGERRTPRDERRVSGFHRNRRAQKPKAAKYPKGDFAANVRIAFPQSRRSRSAGRRGSRPFRPPSRWRAAACR